MKSLSRVTLLVRMKISRGGHSAVYVWLLIVSAVMFSGFENLRGFAVVVDCKRGDSGSRAVVEDIESSTSDPTPASGDASLIGSRASGRLE